LVRGPPARTGCREASRVLGDDDLVRLSDTLQACCQVRSLANDAALLRLTGPYQITDYDQPRGDADASVQWSSRLQPSHRLDQLQPGPDRPLSIVFVGLRIAKVHEYSIAHILRYEPAEALDSLGHALLIGGDDLAQVLRVHASGKCRGSH
jgi:hypothetical protein